MDAITGMKTADPDVRAHPNGSRARVDPGGLDHGRRQGLDGILKALKMSPTGTASGTDAVGCSFEEYTDFVGLKDDRAMENETCPASGSTEESTRARKKIVG